MSTVFEGEGPIWHLIKPKQFEPRVGTRYGDAMAADVCYQAAAAKINRPDYDHSVYSEFVEVTIGSVVYHPRARIAGKKTEPYDIVIKGTSFYRPANPDLNAINFTCLLSPMLELRAIQSK